VRSQAPWVRPLPTEFLAGAKPDFVSALPFRLKRLPDEGRVRGCLGARLAGSVETAPEQVRAAVLTLMGRSQASGLSGQTPYSIWFAALLYFAVTLMAWLLWIPSGDWSHASAAFGLPYKLFLTFTAVVGMVLAMIACRQFPDDHPLHAAWLLFSLSSGCRIVGAGIQTAAEVWSGLQKAAAMPAAEFAAGPLALVPLGCGLMLVYRAYRSVGLHTPLRLGDWMLLGLGSLFTIRHIAEIGGILLRGPSQPVLVVLSWLSEPAALFVLAAAVPLRRAAMAQGGGLIAAAWSAMAAGAMLGFFGNLLIFFRNYGYISWPLSTVSWLVWIPVYTAFALGPAYQLAANGALAEAPLTAPQQR